MLIILNMIMANIIIKKKTKRKESTKIHLMV